LKTIDQWLVASITLAEVFKSVLRRTASDYAIPNWRRRAIERCAHPKAMQLTGEDANALQLDNRSLMERTNGHICSSCEVGW